MRDRTPELHFLVSCRKSRHRAEMFSEWADREDGAAVERLLAEAGELPAFANLLEGEGDPCLGAPPRVNTKDRSVTPVLTPSCAGVAAAGAEGDADAELAEAVRRSIGDGLPVRSRDGTVLMKLTRDSREEAVAEVLETPEELENCRRTVRESGCQVMPAGRLGPKFFAPVAVEPHA